jgi:hypothetical protein
MFLINALWPVETDDAGGMINFKPAVDADTSMMFATTSLTLPLMGHSSVVSVVIVRDS